MADDKKSQNDEGIETFRVGGGFVPPSPPPTKNKDGERGFVPPPPPPAKPDKSGD